MTSLEDRLSRALRDPPLRPTSPDLFERVVHDIVDDRARRRRRLLFLGLLTLILAALTVAVIVATPRDNGELIMPWWILELAMNAVLVGLALWLGPFIKRFGRAYAADVFHDNPVTGKSYIVLTDIVYYLIFTAYILFTVQFAPPTALRYVGAEQLQYAAMRLGGILLIIGVLHGANIVLLPVLGRLFSKNRRLGPVE